MVKALQMTLTVLGGLARPWWLASPQIRLACGNLKHNTGMECENQHLARAEFRVGVSSCELLNVRKAWPMDMKKV